MVSAQTGAIQEPFNLYSSISRRYLWEPDCVCARWRPTAREPSAAVAYAAIDERVIDVSGKRVGESAKLVATCLRPVPSLRWFLQWRDGPQGRGYSAFLDFRRSPEFAECVWPAPVGDAISSGFSHSVPQRGIHHQRSNRARQVIHIV